MDPTAMNNQQSAVLTEQQAKEMIAFLVSSAEISLSEPIYYGTFRLVDAASRLMGYMLENGDLEAEDFFRNLKDEIDANKTSMLWDREAYRQFLRDTPAIVASEMAADAESTAKAD